MRDLPTTSESALRMNLSKAQIKRLRSTSHQLKPVVMMGQNGMTEAVQKEIEIAIEHHELIKIRLPAADKVAKKQMIEIICKHHNAEPVQSIGNVVVIYRRNIKTDRFGKITSN
jgi:RNA-binding protein